MQWALMGVVVVFSQIVSGGRLRHAAVHDAQVAEVIDAAVDVVSHGREPAANAVAPSDTAPPPPREVEHAPWWVYVVLCSAIVGPFAIPAVIVIWRKRSEAQLNNEVRRFKLPQESDPSLVPQSPDASSVVPKSTADYAAYLGDIAEVKNLLPSGTKRTPEQCHEIYLDGVKSFVERMVWPERMRVLQIENAPIETKWRAWIGDQGWDSSIVRGLGRTQAQAMKGLLRSYQQHGGIWIAHAIERSSPSKSQR